MLTLHTKMSGNKNLRPAGAVYLGLVILTTATRCLAADDRNDPTVLHVLINSEKEAARVDTGFLSFTTETGRFMRRKIPYHSQHHKTQQRFLALCQGLSLQNKFPSAYWRIGGRKSSELVFRKSGGENFNPAKNAFDAHDWDELHTFARKLNWTVNFAINGLLRKGDGSWNSSNAKELLRYTKTKGYSVNFDLGKGKSTNEGNQTGKSAMHLGHLGFLQSTFEISAVIEAAQFSSST